MPTRFYNQKAENVLLYEEDVSTRMKQEGTESVMYFGYDSTTTIIPVCICLSGWLAVWLSASEEM